MIKLEDNPLLYVVLKLQKDISYINPINQEEEIIELGGCAGYIPAFNTFEEAEKNSENGKYEITVIKIK